MNTFFKFIITLIICAVFIIFCINLYDLYTAIFPATALTTTISIGAVSVATDDKLSWGLVFMILVLFVGSVTGTALIYKLIDKWVK